MMKENEMGTSTTERKTACSMGSVARIGIGVLAIAALGGALAGCGGGDGGGGGGGGGCADGQVSASWDVVGGCFAGDYVVIRVDDDTMTQDYDCDLGGGTTPPVEGGVIHAVDLTLFDVNNNPLEVSPAVNVTVPCGGVGSTPTYDFNPG
jgi:hypothetical protein